MIDIEMSNEKSTISTVHNGEVVRRDIPQEDILALLEGHCSFDTGLLPPNTRYYKKQGQRVGILVEVPYHSRTIFVKHDGSSKQIILEDVPMPAGLFAYDVTLRANGNLTLTRGILFAMKRQGMVDFDTPLFRYPAPNINTGGGICWGHDAGKLFANIKTLSALEGAARAYFRTNFNDHMWDKSAVTRDFPWGNINYRLVEDYFQKVKEVGEFKDEWLAKVYSTPRRVLSSMGCKV